MEVNFKYELDQLVYLELDKKFWQGRISSRKYIEFMQSSDDDGERVLLKRNEYGVVTKSKNLQYSEEQFGKDIFLTREELIAGRLTIEPLL